jgi:hypothetical protein
MPWRAVIHCLRLDLLSSDLSLSVSVCASVVYLCSGLFMFWSENLLAFVVVIWSELIVGFRHLVLALFFLTWASSSRSNISCIPDIIVVSRVSLIEASALRVFLIMLDPYKN